MALADIDILEARTAQPDWHRALGLIAPEQLGKAIRFDVRDENGAEMVRILIGKNQASEAEAVQKIDDLGVEKSRFYVRLEDSNQSWLALGRVPRNPEAAAWIDPFLPRHEVPLLREIAIGKGGGAFKAVRVGDASSDAWSNSWSMPGAPRWLQGFAALRPDDVTKAETINFDTARPFTLSYADGLSLTYENVGAATVIWSRISAKADVTASAEVKAKAAAINARFNGWALRFAAERTPILLASKNDFQR